MLQGKIRYSVLQRRLRSTISVRLSVWSILVSLRKEFCRDVSLAPLRSREILVTKPTVQSIVE